MMKRLLIATSLALIGIAGVLFYYWQQATQIPSWYSANESIDPYSQSPVAEGNKTEGNKTEGNKTEGNKTEGNKSLGNSSGSNRLDTNRLDTNSDTPTAKQEQKKIDAKIANQIQKTPDRKKVNVQLDQKELNTLFTSEVSRKAQNSKFAEAIKGVNTTIQNGTVESGAVINLGNISPDRLPENEQEVFAKLISAFPDLGKRDVYIGLEGKPTVVDGQVMLDGNTRIKLGNLSFTPAELAQRLGIPEDKIRQQIQLHLQVNGVSVDNFELVGDRAVIQGTPD